MSSEPTPSPSFRLGLGARRWLPWGAWALAAAAALTLTVAGPGLSTAPAVAEVRAVSLSSPQPLEVSSLEVGPGQRVDAGQVVARLDSTRVDAQLAMARARLEQLKLEVGAREVEYRSQLGRTSGRAFEQLDRLGLSVVDLEAAERRDRAQLAELDEQMARQARLVQEQLASADAINQLKLQRSALALRVEADVAALKKTREALAAAQKRSADWRPAKGEARAEATGLAALIEAQLAPLKMAVAAQQEEVAMLAALRESLDLKAPFEGTVGEVLLRPGETASVGRPVITIVDARVAGAVAWVDQAWAGRVQVGDEVSLVPVDRSGPTAKGRVTALGPSLVQTPPRFQMVQSHLAYSREARIELAPGTPPLTPGQAFRAAFKPGSGEAARVGAR